MNPSIAIIGAGVSGLYAASLLIEKGYDVTVFEARDRIGGRVLNHDGFDLGPTWYRSGMLDSDGTDWSLRCIDVDAYAQPGTNQFIGHCSGNLRNRYNRVASLDQRLGELDPEHVTRKVYARGKVGIFQK